jgi:hypothetical protein
MVWWRGAAPCARAPTSSARGRGVARSPSARACLRPGVRPWLPQCPALVPTRRGTPAQRGPGPVRLRLERPRCPCVARRMRGSFAARQRGLACAHARVVRSALAWLTVPSGRRIGSRRGFHAHPPPAGRGHPPPPPPPCILCVLTTLFVLMKWKLNSEIDYVNYLT